MEAKIIKADGTVEIVTPKNGSIFSLEELQAVVEGYIEIIRVDATTLMILNEEGKLHGLPFNVKATDLVRNILVGDFIVGNVLVAPNVMID